jgi:hypothetical protein
MNAGFTEIIITPDNKQQIVGDFSSNSYDDFGENDHDFGLFHSATVWFHRSTSRNRMIQFNTFHWNNSSMFRSISGSTSPENASSRLLTASRQGGNSQFCSVSSQNWRAEIHKIASATLFSSINTCDFFLFGYLKKELRGMNCRSHNGIISAMTMILGDIPVRMLSGVFDYRWKDYPGAVQMVGSMSK